MPSLGPLIARQSSQLGYIGTYDTRYLSQELVHFQKFLTVENDPQGAYLDHNHYGGLRQRLSWAVRNGQPYGPAVTDENTSGYARGKRILDRYLRYSRDGSHYNTQAHHNTGLADVEALYVLEGNQEALPHIHVSAMGATYRDPWGYWNMSITNTHADPRQLTVALQALMAAHRLNIPYGRNPANPGIGFDSSYGSWKAAARSRVDLATKSYSVVQADGTLFSPAHKAEAYLFNAWYATELMNYYAYVESDPQVLQVSQRLMDHMIDQYNQIYKARGWATLPYMSTSSSAAPDLAGFYVWPSLVLWQETGNQKYYDFALQNIKASNTGYIGYTKQWNEIFSMRAQSAEALLAGVSWK